ncbi:MAG: Gfo/Idh/MocA family oxidoreductase [Planctomycetaceae bacterium]|jgi:predicted dehydrogenase|nr:Gfo/Idh/MocA family oxidoreductase [Planctomycetaceae bacterium]
MSDKKINVAMIGQGFMGRSHSNAWCQVNKFFDPPINSVLHTVYGMEAEKPHLFAAKWGWQHSSTDWETLVKSPEIGLVDIVTPNFMHAPPAKAAVTAGKPCSCEKPVAATLAEAREMAEAAKKANVDSFVWFVYRRAPAVAFAHQLVKEGAVGEIRHVRAVYLQDWADESVPFAWRFKKELAGSGSHGDLNAHIVDMTKFVTGLDIEVVCGAVAETFVKKRKIIEQDSGGGIVTDEKMRYMKEDTGSAKLGDVTVDDTVLFLVKYNNGAVGSYEAARQATGNQNFNGFEINGTKGSLKFNFEDMNHLQYYDATRPRAVQGWTTIMCTHGGVHPYVANYWPDAHLIGYEHGFTSMAYDILLKLAGKTPTVPLPDFDDAYQTQRVLEAALIAANEKRWVKLDEVK